MSLFQAMSVRLNGVYTALKQAFVINKNQTDGSEISTYYDGNVRTITPERLKTLLEAADGGDICAMHALFYEIEEQDPHIFAEMQKRKNAVLTLDWSVKPPRDASKKEIELAEWVQKKLTDFTQFEDVMVDCLDGIGHGFSALEIEWTKNSNEILPKEIIWRPQSWFKINKKQELRLIDKQNNDGAELWPDHWIIHKHKTKSGMLARSGLHRVLAWTFVFKHYAVSDLAEFLEIYGLPVRIGKYPEGTDAKARKTLLNAVASLGHNAAGIMPQNMSIELANAVNGSEKPFLAMYTVCERNQSKVILGGTLTSQADGKSSTNALGNIHNEVRHDILTSDAKQLAQTLTTQLIYPLLHLNFEGVDVGRLPYFEFDTRQLEDLTKLVDALDKAIDFIDVGADWFYDKSGIPKPVEGDAILTRKSTKEAEVKTETFSLSQHGSDCGCTNQALTDAIAAVKDPQILKALTAQSDLESAINTLPSKYVTSYDATVMQVIAALQATNSYDEAQSVLYALMPDLDTKKFNEAMTQAIMIADVAGRVSNGD